MVRSCETDSLNGRYLSAKNVIQAFELGRVLNGHDIPNVFYHAYDGGITATAAADLTELGVGNVVAI